MIPIHSHGSSGLGLVTPDSRRTPSSSCSTSERRSDLRLFNILYVFKLKPAKRFVAAQCRFTKASQHRMSSSPVLLTVATKPITTMTSPLPSDAIMSSAMIRQRAFRSRQLTITRPYATSSIASSPTFCAQARGASRLQDISGYAVHTLGTLPRHVFLTKSTRRGQAMGPASMPMLAHEDINWDCVLRRPHSSGATPPQRQVASTLAPAGPRRLQRPCPSSATALATPMPQQ